MKKLLFFALFVEVIGLAFLALAIQMIDPASRTYWLYIGGVRKNKSLQTASTTSLQYQYVSGSQALKDEFPVLLEAEDELTFEKVEEFEMTYGREQIAGLQIDEDMKYTNSFVELPLFAEDYYWGKYENGSAGVRGINQIASLRPGDKISLIGDQYINVKSYNGFIKPQSGYGFGSGLCWSTSALGYLMDEANAAFKQKYGIDLFIINNRAPHSHNYRSYLPSNNGWGYTVLQRSTGIAVQDYIFTVNPALKNNSKLADIKIKIVMVATNQHPTASHGQSIGGYILSNVDFDSK